MTRIEGGFVGEFAVLGWGSLIWDLEILEPHVRGPWGMGAGPALPMEFTRISPKRKLGLVVCLDADHGVPCQTHAIASLRSDIEAVAGDLAARERAPDHYIGAVCLTSGTARGASGAVIGAVRDWCERTGWAGAVWTDLPSNYAEMRGEGFSIEGALAYLRGLTGESLDEAVRYIQSAPALTDTPLRRTLAADEWWRAEARRLGL